MLGTPSRPTFSPRSVPRNPIYRVPAPRRAPPAFVPSKAAGIVSLEVAIAGSGAIAANVVRDRRSLAAEIAGGNPPLAFENLGVSTGTTPASPDIRETADASVYTTPAWTPPLGLLVCWVFADGEATLTGNGLTWTTILSAENAGKTLTLVAADGKGATPGATTITFGAVQSGCYAMFSRVRNADLSAGEAAAFGPTVDNFGTGASGSINLGATLDRDNRVIACFVHAANEVATERANWTKLDDLNGALPDNGMISQFRADVYEGTASASWATSAAWIGIAAAVKALPDSVTVNVVRDKRALVSSVAGVGTVSPNFVRDKRVLQASVAGAGAVAPLLGRVRPIDAAIAGTSSVSPSLVRTRGLAVAITGSGAVTGNFVRSVRALSVAVVGTGTVAGTFVRNIRTLAVAIAGVGSVVADLTVTPAGGVVANLLRRAMRYGE